LFMNVRVGTMGLAWMAAAWGLLVSVPVGPAARSRGEPPQSRLEREILSEHNLVRSDPAQYAGFLREFKRRFDGRVVQVSPNVVRITSEGVRAVDEAIRFLHRTDPLPALRHARGMARGARDHVRDQGPRGAVGHAGSDGSQPWDRVNRYGAWTGTIAENVAYGYDTARDVVMQLIIDDGVPDRGHRANIFDPAFRVAGVSCGEHAEFEIMCVIAYASAYDEGG
jgi:uncharacterized protein YkwD